MLIIREVFVAKPGNGSKLAKLFKEVMPKMMGGAVEVKVMTDAVGNYNTVVMEYEVDSLSSYEKGMTEGMSKPNPDVEKAMKNYTDMYYKGRREIFRVW